MTKKHTALIIQALIRARHAAEKMEDGHDLKRGVGMARDKIANALAADSNTFDRRAFILACRGGSR